VTTTGDKQFTSSFGSSQHKEVTVKTRDSPLDTPPSKTGPQLGIFEKYANQTEWEPDTLEDVEPVVREE